MLKPRGRMAGGSIPVKGVTTLRLVVENILAALGYWGVSHVNFIIFKKVGVLPMPIWPAAALALVFAFYRGWMSMPGIAAGTILANHYSISAPWNYAVLIAVMNTLGPIAGAWLVRSRVSPGLYIRSLGDVLICFFAGMVLMPVLTATGGIGFKYVLGLIAKEAVFAAWLKWYLAHSLGALIFGVPVFAWLKGACRS